MQPAPARTTASAIGTENAVVTTCPAPLTPTRTPRSLYGNVVQIVPGAPRSVAVIEVVDVVVVEVDRLLHQPHAEQVEAEVQVLLGVVDGGSDMMQAENRVSHRTILPALTRRSWPRARANIRASEHRVTIAGQEDS